MSYVGIDIAAKKVDVVIRKNGHNQKATVHEQSVEGREKLAEMLKSLSPQCIVMEATGIYFLDLAYTLHRHGLSVSVINPKSYHHFAKSLLLSSKTDAIDAALLAQYGEMYKPKAWEPPQKTCRDLRAIGRKLNRLTYQRTQMKNALHAMKSTNETPDYLIEDEKEGIDTLNQRIAKLTQIARVLVDQDANLARGFECLKSAKGVGETTALMVLSELCVLPKTMKSSQISRYAGLDVKQTQSGSSVRSAGRISKAGNGYLRQSLYMSALSSARYEKRANAFYLGLIASGKKKKQALCAVMRKYLTGLWACIKNEEAFDSEKLFSDIHFEKMNR